MTEVLKVWMQDIMHWLFRVINQVYEHFLCIKVNMLLSNNLLYDSQDSFILYT